MLPSLGRIAAGRAIAVVVGGVAGVAIGRPVALSGYLDPLPQFARALSAVTLVPVFIALFRIGTEMEVATIAFGTVWPILLNTIDGARSVDRCRRETARAFRLPGQQRLTLAVRRGRLMTILLVTHDIDESVYVGDRVVVLTPGPGRVRADLPVGPPAPRDQITTRELPAFVRLRTEVSRLVRGQPGGEGAPGRAGGVGDSGGAGGAEYWGRERNRSRAARASQE